VDARTGLVIGGMTAVAASVAVVCAVAMTNTAALKDTPATTVAAARILVPAASSPSATPSPSPVEPAPVVTPNEAEVVEAPDPTEVVPSVPGDSTPPPAAAAAPPAPAAEKSVGDVDAAIEAARATGTWDSLRAWAAARGWSTGRIDALIERLVREATADRLTGSAELQGPGAGEPAQKEAGTAERNGSLQTQVAPSKPQVTQQKTHPEHPANAGSNGNGNGAGPHAKKDQSRNSPDKRD